MFGNALRRNIWFNLKIEHFWHLNCVKREKITLRYIMQLKIKWKGLRPLRSTISNELIMTESVTSLSVLKKKQLAIHRKKKRSLRWYYRD